jgi:hypothetical protein
VNRPASQTGTVWNKCTWNGSAVRCGAVRCGAARCGAVRCGAVRCGVVRWCNTKAIYDILCQPMDIGMYMGRTVPTSEARERGSLGHEHTRRTAVRAHGARRTAHGNANGAHERVARPSVRPPVSVRPSVRPSPSVRPRPSVRPSRPLLDSSSTPPRLLFDCPRLLFGCLRLLLDYSVTVCDSSFR